MKDEYSKKLFVWTLKDKSLTEVLPTLVQFEAWVKRQYGLSICKIKHDSERAVLGINPATETAYQAWVAEEGIDLEVSPSHTHEPNGGAERAGQELINKSITMRKGANLPVKLWPEAVKTACYLYNKSPIQSLDWRSPDEHLESWFRSYFRFYSPALVTRVTVDLKPNWSNIYAYGCRAYPLQKDREAGRDKRMYKVLPRGHIGYLVGYQASNVYRIWLPSLDRVIVTRNVTFNELTKYLPEREKQDGQPIPIAKQIVSQIELSEEEELRLHDDGASSARVLRSDTRSNSRQTGQAGRDDARVSGSHEQDLGVMRSKGRQLGPPTRSTASPQRLRDVRGVSLESQREVYPTPQFSEEVYPSSKFSRIRVEIPYNPSLRAAATTAVRAQNSQFSVFSTQLYTFQLDSFFTTF